jgi:uncharacterized protein DUF4386
MNTLKQQARRAGLLYVAIVLIAPIGLMYVPGELIVTGNATATADNIRAAQALFRLGIASELVQQAIGIFLVLALYRIFKPVSEGLARQLVVLGALVSVPIVFLNVLNNLAALTLVRGPDFLAVFDRAQLDALAYLSIRLHSFGITVASVFWGLWFFPFGLLVVRSRFIPKAFGYLLMMAGTAYLAAATTAIALPQFAPIVSKFALTLEVAELPIVVWLVIWGARTVPPNSPAAIA